MTGADNNNIGLREWQTSFRHQNHPPTRCWRNFARLPVARPTSDFYKSIRRRSCTLPGSMPTTRIVSMIVICLFPKNSAPTIFIAWLATSQRALPASEVGYTSWSLTCVLTGDGIEEAGQGYSSRSKSSQSWTGMFSNTVFSSV